MIGIMGSLLSVKLTVLVVDLIQRIKPKCRRRKSTTTKVHSTVSDISFYETRGKSSLS